MAHLIFIKMYMFQIHVRYRPHVCRARVPHFSRRNLDVFFMRSAAFPHRAFTRPRPTLCLGKRGRRAVFQATPR